jgi:uncharacterized membrane protein YdjX (TVP38/TMEM64 family)
MNKTVLRWLLGLTLLAAVAAAIALRDRFDAAALETWVSSAGAAGPLLFMALYALATVLFLPGSVITLAGGALFGPVWGTLWNLTGATIGASLAFLIARYLGADWVARRAGPRLQSLNEGVSAEGWRFVAFVRLVPLFPFNLLNYALGLTRIPFPAYVLASWLFMLPGAFAYTWLGFAGREALAGGEGMIRNILIALALLAAVGFIPRLVKRLRAKPAVTLDIPGLNARLGGEDRGAGRARRRRLRRGPHRRGAQHPPAGTEAAPGRTGGLARPSGRRGLPHRQALRRGGADAGRTGLQGTAAGEGRHAALEERWPAVEPIEHGVTDNEERHAHPDGLRRNHPPAPRQPRAPPPRAPCPDAIPLWVQALSMAAFTLAFVGWLNETWLFWFDNPIWLNRYTEYAIIFAFGVWRIAAEENPYTRKRLIVLVAAVTGLWWLVPWLVPMFEPYIGYQWGQPVFPALHVPGTITFFLSSWPPCSCSAGASSAAGTAPASASARRWASPSATAPCAAGGPGRCAT